MLVGVKRLRTYLLISQQPGCQEAVLKACVIVEIYCILSRVLARRRYMRYGGNIIERASLGGWL